MSELERRWKSVTNKEKWAARGASFVAKAKATKVVWFPPGPVGAGKEAASTAKRAGKKTAGTGRKATRTATKKTAKGASSKASGPTRKTTTGAKKVTNPVRRKKA